MQKLCSAPFLPSSPDAIPDTLPLCVPVPSNRYIQRMEQLSVDFAKKRRKGKLPSEATGALKSWWEANIDNPYPTVRLSKVSSRFPTVPDALRGLTLCPPSIAVDVENYLGHDSKWLYHPAHKVPPIACC